MSDYFTRLIAQNSVGPNILSADEDDVEQVYICGTCETAHDYHHEAQSCCPVEVYAEWRCGTCSEVHGQKADAVSCCGTGAAPMSCPVCIERAESYRDAADCCLFLHPSISPAARERIADAVENGAAWADAIKANENH